MERKAKSIFGWILGAAIVLPGVVFADKVDELLQSADALRSKDPVAFGRELDRIDGLLSQASELQQRRYRVLRAYRKLFTGKYDAAIKEALAVHSEAKDAETQFRAALLIANGAAITREFSLGLRYLEAALSQVSQVSEMELRHRAYLTASILYNQYGQFGLGQNYAQRLLVQEVSPRSRCLARQLRAESTLGLGSALLDEKEVNEAIAECDGLGEVIPAAQLRGYLAQQWATRGEPARAIALLESRIAEVEATRYPRLIGAIHGMLAEYRLMVGNLAEAERHAREAIENGAGDAYSSLPLVAAHKVLYEIALSRNDVRGALEQYRRYAEADKARLDEIKAREFAFQLSRHELQQKNQSIELLRKQNEVLTLQQQVSQASAQNSRLLLTLLGLVIAAIAMWAYKVKRMQVAFRRQAEVDGLTGISNRRHFRQNAEALLQRCAGAGREASLVLLDLDFFKQINDAHGHAVGDWVLQQVALACKAACREGDVCGRLGGEEFGILSCGSDIDAARRIAQRVREHLAAIDTTVIGQPVTASFGLTTSTRSGHAFEAMFAHADAAMYHAKGSGRDRVRVYGEDGAVPATVLELVRS